MIQFRLQKLETCVQPRGPLLRPQISDLRTQDSGFQDKLAYANPSIEVITFMQNTVLNNYSYSDIIEKLLSNLKLISIYEGLSTPP